LLLVFMFVGPFLSSPWGKPWNCSGCARGGRRRTPRFPRLRDRARM